MTLFIGDASPANTVTNTRDSAAIDAIAASDGSHILVAFAQKATNSVYVGFRESCHGVSCPVGRAPFRDHVTLIVESGAEKEVGGIDAAGIIPAGAVMADLQPLGYRSVCHLPRYAVYQQCPAFSTHSHRAITFGGQTACPQPATLGLVDERPETHINGNMCFAATRFHSADGGTGQAGTDAGVEGCITDRTISRNERFVIMAPANSTAETLSVLVGGEWLPAVVTNDMIEMHSDLLCLGVIPPAGNDSAGDSCCPNYTIGMREIPLVYRHLIQTGKLTEWPGDRWDATPGVWG